MRKIRVRVCPVWLADVVDCPGCGKKRVITPSGYVGCRVPGCCRLYPRGVFEAAVGDAYRAAVETGRTRIGSEKRAVSLAWSYLRGRAERKDVNRGS